MTPQAAPETPQPMNYQYEDPASMAAPSPAPSHGSGTLNNSFESTSVPATPAGQAAAENLDESVSYEPEAKRLRTASAEEELKDVEAGKGTGACIKYTQVNNRINRFEPVRTQSCKIISKQIVLCCVFVPS